MNFETRERLRWLVPLINYHRPGEKQDIVVLGSPRSGSTWLMEILYAEPGMSIVHEPLGKKVGDRHRLLPFERPWNITSLSDDTEPLLREFFLDPRKTAMLRQKSIFHKNYDFCTNRRVLKIVRGNCLIQWFNEALGFSVVYLLRHPIPQSLSCVQRGHICHLADFIADEQFVRENLDRDQLEFAQQIEKSGSNVERFVVEWCLHNLIPLRYCSESQQAVVVSYEELVVRPGQVVDLLCEKFDLQGKERMLSQIGVPSKSSDSSSPDTIEQIGAGKSLELVSKWRKKVDAEQQRKLFDILDRFEIDAYQPDNPLPTAKWLQFGDNVLS